MSLCRTSYELKWIEKRLGATIAMSSPTVSFSAKRVKAVTSGPSSVDVEGITDAVSPARGIAQSLSSDQSFCSSRLRCSRVQMNKRCDLFQ